MLPQTTRILITAPATAFVAVNLLFGILALAMPDFFWVRLVYDVNTLIFPAVFALCGLGFFFMRGDRTRRLRFAALLVAAAVVCGGARVYATHIEPRQLQIRQARLPGGHTGAPIRIVHISDIQSDAVGDWERKVAGVVGSLEPDLIIHTGDLLHPIPPATIDSELPKLEAIFGPLHSRLGKFLVDGDTDYWLRRTDLRQAAGMERLSSRSVSLEIPGGRVHILGLSLMESANPGAAARHVREWLRDKPESDLTIVAGHRPDYAMGLTDLPVDLVLGGHTHGGQIRVPFYGPLVTFSRVPREWARGFRRIGIPWLNVSAGIGAEHSMGLPSIRLNCPPELTVITIDGRTSGA